MCPSKLRRKSAGCAARHTRSPRVKFMPHLLRRHGDKPATLRRPAELRHRQATRFQRSQHRCAPFWCWDHLPLPASHSVRMPLPISDSAPSITYVQNHLHEPPSKKKGAPSVNGSDLTLPPHIRLFPAPDSPRRNARKPPCISLRTGLWSISMAARYPARLLSPASSWILPRTSDAS